MVNGRRLSSSALLLTFCLSLLAFAGLLEETAEGERLSWDRTITEALDRGAGLSGARADRLLAFAVWGGGVLLAAAMLVLVFLAGSSRRRVLVSAIGGLFVVGYGTSIVYLGWSEPSYVVAGWSLSTAWVSGLWLALPSRVGSGPSSGAGVRSFVRGLLRRQPVDDLLDWLRFRFDTFPRSVAWLRPLKLPELRSGTYHELPWVGVRGGQRAESTKTRWERIEPLVVENGVRSALDVGAGSGWFTFKLAELGVPTVAVEHEDRALRIGLYTRKRSGLRDTGFLLVDVTPWRVRLLPAADCTLVLSVWHHFVRQHGLDGATEILAGIWAKTGRVLVFETGEEEMPPSWRLPAMTPDPRTWLTGYLAQVCTGAAIVHLGLHEALDPDGATCRRNLFAAVRAGPQQQV
jgi:SAM-dependent methyltransferase